MAVAGEEIQTQEIEDIIENIKLVVVGDFDSKKNQILDIIAGTDLDDGFMPISFEDKRILHKVGRIKLGVSLSSTYGVENYDNLRFNYYPNADLFLLCFYFDVPKSYENAIHKWLKEIRSYAPKTSVVLLGIRHKVDSMTSNNQPTLERGFETGLEKLGIDGFAICDLDRRETVVAAFNHAFVAALARNKKTKLIARYCQKEIITFGEPEQRFISESIEFSKVFRSDNKDALFAWLPLDVAKLILTHLARLEGCTRDPRNVINLMLSNIRENKWQTCCKVNGEYKAIFAKPQPNRFLGQAQRALATGNGRRRDRAERDPGFIASLINRFTL